MSTREDRYPESPVFYRCLTRRFPRILRGQGCFLYDASGKRYLDAVGGAFVANLGHGLAEVADALSAQARQVAYVNGTAFTSQPAEELAEELVRLAPPGLDKAYFLSSGSEAVEAALKLARQYWVETGKPTKHKIIARTPGYHGNTLLALSASARQHYKKLYGPWLVPTTLIPAPYAYRCSCDGTADCPACSGSALEEAVLREGAESVAAFIAEPVGGSSTGAAVPRPDYYKNIRRICDKHGILFIADEVLCGAGRTGRWLAIEHFEVVPDIITLGKGISGGYAPLSAVLSSRKITDALARGTGAFKHAQTFSHSPLISAAGLAAVRYIKSHKLVERASSIGALFHKKLSVLKDLPGVGDVRGLGLLAGVELVADKASKAPYPRSLKLAEIFTEVAQERGLIVWPNVGQTQDEQGDIIMLAPPFIVTEAEMDEIVSLFQAALIETLEKINDYSRRVV